MVNNLSNLPHDAGLCWLALCSLLSNSEPEPDLCAELTKHEKYDEGVVRKYVGEI